MIYVSIDIETTGLDPLSNNVLSIGAIIEDTTKKLPYDECPKFNAIVLNKQLQGSPRAITMNKEVISMIGEYLEGTDEVRETLNNNSGYKFYEEDEVVKKFFIFLLDNNVIDNEWTNNWKSGGKDINSNSRPVTINVAGKNFGTFDKLFLQELPWWQKLIRTRQRVLDPAILCVDWNNDTALPSLTQCKERTNVEGIVTHNALEDAWDVIQVLRNFY
jgi:hypothetical protein